MCNRDRQNGLQLVGYRMDKLGAEDQRGLTLRAGDAIHLVLFWRKLEPLSPDGAYRLTLGALSRETTPSPFYPVALWSTGEVVRDDQIIQIPNDWSAGTYVLAVNGQRIADVEIR